jgi:hypothetical protein
VVDAIGSPGRIIEQVGAKLSEVLARVRLARIPTVVTTLGGGYFFLPSLTALARIAAGP